MASTTFQQLVLIGVAAGALATSAPVTAQAQGDRQGGGQQQQQQQDGRGLPQRDGRDVRSRSDRGRGNGYGHRHDHDGYGRVTSIDGMVAVRDAFNKRGYIVTRDRWVGDSRVVYYRQNRGRGPIRRMIIRPSGETVLFDSAPDDVVGDLRIRLNL